MGAYDGIMPRVVSSGEEDEVSAALREFAQLQVTKTNFNQQFEEVAQLLMPSYRNTFMYGSNTAPGTKKTDHQVDATGMMALSRFGAICDSLLTPRNQMWHSIEAEDDYVMKDRATRLWFEDTTRRLFKLRYSATANYASQNQSIYKSLGAFGTGGLFIDRLYDPRGTKGFRYRAMPLGEIYIKENHQGLVDGFIRHFQLTARQAEQRWPGKLPAQLIVALDKNSEQLFNFLHRVCPRTDNYDPGAYDARSKPFKSQYIALEGRCMMPNPDSGALEGGYNSFPAAISRYEQAPGEVYGQSPAMQVLPALKTLNAEKTVFLKQGHRAGDPTLLVHDDSIVPTIRPGSFVPGGVNADGRPLVIPLQGGNIQITKEMMQEERQLINDAFLVSLFQILTESPQMTATEVIERINEKGILLAPTVGRQMSEYLGPKIHRELDLASDMGLLLPMPPRLQEANGSYQVKYTSPLAKAMRAGDASGFMRLVSELKEIFAVTQDPSLFDPISFDRATPDLADIHSVPPEWMASDEEIGGIRQNRAKQQQIQQRIQAAPAAAAMMKAQAVAGEQGAQ